MLELRDGSCFSKALVGVNVGLACVDGVISVLALIQLMRIHSRNVHIGWTRQKVFHLLIALSNLGFFFYFVLSPVAVCEGWFCWQWSCGFVAMACPKLLFLTVFLLLLSFWVDLCHQSNDEEDDDDGYSSWEALLEENKLHSNVDTHRNCCFCSASQIESRQKVVILVTALVFVLMLAAAVLIWIGRGKSPIDSSVVARAYVDLFAILVLLLVAALAYYGLVLFLKMSRVRSERASSEIWKVAGLAIVSVLCFTSSSFISIFTDVPLLYNNWSEQNINVVSTSLLVVLYYFVGSSVPSAFVLWVMRELPPVVTQRQQEPSTIAFITDSTSTSNPQRWTTVASLQN